MVALSRACGAFTLGASRNGLIIFCDRDSGRNRCLVADISGNECRQQRVTPDVKAESASQFTAATTTVNCRGPPAGRGTGPARQSRHIDAVQPLFTQNPAGATMTFGVTRKARTPQNPSSRHVASHPLLSIISCLFRVLLNWLASLLHFLLDFFNFSLNFLFFVTARTNCSHIVE